MPVTVRFGASQTCFDARAGVLALSMPWLAGAKEEPLWPGELTSLGDGLLAGTDGPWRCLALSVPVDGAMTGTARRIFSTLLEALGPAHFLRIWNFVPAINAETDGLENYRAFCLGRHEAFAAHFGTAADRYFCAASAVGIDGPHLSVIALATELPVTHLENPFQCPAYQYPQRYGPRPPSFSRASVVGGEEPAVYISGTSAVLGSATVAPDELHGQLETTGENLHRMLGQCERELGAEPFARLGAPFCRVYLRRAGDAPAVTAWLETQSWFSPERASVVRSDICRQELRVEIELSWPSVLAGSGVGGKVHAHGSDPL